MQCFNIFVELRVYPKCFHFVLHLSWKIVHHRIIAGLLDCICICLFDFCGSVQHGVGFRGSFRRLRLFSAPLQLFLNRFIVQPCKIVLCGFRFGNSLRVRQRNLFRWLFRCFRFYRLTDPIVLIAESCAVQALDDMRHGVVEVVGGSQNIGHIECALRMLARMGQTENPSQNLLHVNLTCLIGKGRKNIGKGAIPALFQRIDRDNIANRTAWGHQIGVFQFIHIGGTNGNLLGGNPGVHQLVPQLFKGGRVLLAFRLCLKQCDRADIFARLDVLRICNFFQFVPQVNRVNQHLRLAVPVIDDHGQFDHVFVFQLHRVHIGNDIALLFRRGGQIQHKAGVEVFQHFKAQFRPGMVALVHDDKRVKLVDNLEQGGFVRFFNGAVGFAQRLCKLGKVAVLLIGFQDLLAATTERIVGQHHN